MEAQTLREYHLQLLSEKERECVEVLASLGLDTSLQADWFTEFVSHKIGFEQEHGRTPTIEELASTMNVGRERAKRIVRGYYIQLQRHNIEAAFNAHQLGLDDDFREYWGLVQSGGDAQYLAREADKQRRRGNDGGKAAGNRERDATLVRMADDERKRRELKHLPIPTFADIATKYNREFGDSLSAETVGRAIRRYRNRQAN